MVALGVKKGRLYLLDLFVGINQISSVKLTGCGKHFSGCRHRVALWINREQASV